MKPEDLYIEFRRGEVIWKQNVPGFWNAEPSKRMKMLEHNLALIRATISREK